ncbi:MAG TPA: DUF3800 domain-containing protein [Micromonosporaceae bacterium]
MLIFYVDEFGDHSMLTKPGSPTDLKPGVSKHFILAAVGVRDTSRKPLAEAIFGLKKRHFGLHAERMPWSASEIKGRYLFRAARSVATGHVLEHPDAYVCLDSVVKVNALIEDLGLIFAKFRPIIFAVAVDKAAILSKLWSRTPPPPLGVAYAYLHQRVALTMERLHAGEAAILVADQQTQHESFFRTGEMNAVRDRMTSPLPISPNFDLVLDKPLWIDTALSSWDREILQLPDMVAYTVGELLKRGCVPRERCYLWEQIKPHFAVHWSTGKIRSGGIAIYPSTSRPPREIDLY